MRSTAADQLSELVVDPEEFAAALRQRVPCRLGHTLSTNSMFAHDRLAEVMATVPDQWTKAIESAPSFAKEAAFFTQTDAAELAASLAETPASVRAYHLELVPGYRDVFASVADQLTGLIGRARQRPLSFSVGAFLAAPRTIVGAHVDRHHNVLLQVHGSKQIHIGWFDDPRRQQHEVEGDFACPRRGVSSLPPTKLSGEFHPGDAVYIPPYAFHWTETGDEVSVAVSVAWDTRATSRMVGAHTFNERVRRMRWLPGGAAPVGRSPLRDAAKAALVKVSQRVGG